MIVGNAIFTLLLLVLLVGGAAVVVGKTRFEAPGPLQEDKVVNIPPRSGMIEIADLLKREGVIDEHRLVFIGGVFALAVLSGGTAVRPVVDGVTWIIPVPKSTPLIRQVAVGGELRLPARWPKRGAFTITGLAGADPTARYDTPADRFEFAAGQIDPTWRNLADVEVVGAVRGAGRAVGHRQHEVDPDDLVAARLELVGDGRADEAGRAGEQDPHASRPGTS